MSKRLSTSSLWMLTCILCLMPMAAWGQTDTLTQALLTSDSITVLPSAQPSTLNQETLEADSLSPQPSTLNQETRRQRHERFVPDPIRAMWLGLVFPGGGQIYNRKYWKLPIIYGGFLGCIYALNWNNQMLRDYSQAYLDIMDDDPNTKSYEKMLPMGYNISGRESQFQTIFKNKKNFYRRYRDMSVFVFAAVYVISVIDAYVDAELSTFDISEDLSLHLAPAVISTSGRRLSQPSAHGSMGPQSGLGLALQLHF